MTLLASEKTKGYLAAMAVGEKIRKARQAKQLSLQQVAEKAHLSSATLSRIETNKQSLDLELFVELSGILDLDPGVLLSTRGTGDQSVPVIFDHLSPDQRIGVWRKLTDLTRGQTIRTRYRREHIRQIAVEIEVLVAQMEFMREQIEYLRKRLRNF
jgi:transcriptional regulator with XRE-family HTH domain